MYKKSFQKIIYLVVISIFILPMLFSCTPTAPAAEPAAPAATEAAAAEESTTIKRGGRLLWADGTLSAEPDLRFSTGRADAVLMSNVTEGLLRYNREGNDYEAALSDSWEVSSDNLVYTFHLRPGIKFSDGTDIKATDFVFSIKQVGEVGLWNWLVENIEDVEAPDAEHVKITLKSIQPNFLIQLAMLQLAVYPEDSLGAAAASEDTFTGQDWFRSAITAGPFYIKEFVASDHILLAKNPYYWELAPDGQPLPYLDEIYFSQVPEDTTRVLQVKSGSLDGTQEVPFSQIKELQADTSGTFQFKIFPQQQIYYLFVNNNKPPFDDIKVREALNIAIDRDALVDGATAGVADPAYSFVSKSGMCFDESIKIEYDVERAKQLIKESKYPDGHTGAAIIVPAGRQIGIDIATFAQGMWKEIGINVEVQQVDPAIVSDRFDVEDHEVISGFQWTNQMVDPSQQVVFFTIDPALNSGYKSAEMQDLVDRANIEMDPVKRCELYYEVQRLFNKDQVSIPLFYTVNRIILSPAVMDYQPSSMQWHQFKYTWLNR